MSESLFQDVHIGQHVRAMSSWEGYVQAISDEEACGQGCLVTCWPITLPARPKNGVEWKPITVTEAELQPTGEHDYAAA